VYIRNIFSFFQSYLGKYLELSDNGISVGSEIRASDVRIRESAFTDLLVKTSRPELSFQASSLDVC
jgi:hypothetical protein